MQTGEWEWNLGSHLKTLPTALYIRIHSVLLEMRVKNGIPFYLNLFVKLGLIITTKKPSTVPQCVWKRDFMAPSLIPWKRLKKLWSALCVSESLISYIIILDSLNMSFQINTVNYEKKDPYLYLENGCTFLDISKLSISSQKRRIAVLMRGNIFVFLYHHLLCNNEWWLSLFLL